jgi:hypothetical protein
MNGAEYTTSSNVIKYNTAGVVEWAARIDGSGADSVTGVTTDINNKIYVSGTYGYFQTTASCNGASIKNANGSTAGGLPSACGLGYLVRYTTSGVADWWMYTDNCASLTSPISDASGNLYVISRFDGISSCAMNTNYKYRSGSTAFTVAAGQPYPTTVVFKVNSTGVVVWNSLISSMRYASVMVDGNGNVIVAGQAMTPMTVRHANGTTFSSPSASQWSGFLIKFSSNGVVRWVANSGKQIYGSKMTYVKVIGVDSANNYLIAGSTDWSTSFCHSNGTSALTITGGSAYKLGFVAKYSPDGVFKWASYINQSSSTLFYPSGSVDGTGNVYVSCTYSELFMFLRHRYGASHDGSV